MVSKVLVITLFKVLWMPFKQNLHTSDFPPSVCIVALAVTSARKVVIKWLNPTVSH